jgi:hypothetical protein
MGLLNKDENWWLRLSLVSFALIALGSASVMNRSVATEKQILTDSLNYYKLQTDSLKEELKVQQLTTDHFDWLWTQLSELHPNDAKKIEHETE